MSEHAAGTFEIESWEEEPYDEREGAKLSRTRSNMPSPRSPLAFRTSLLHTNFPEHTL